MKINNSNIENKETYATLFDIYKSLFTETQKEIFNYYFNLDYSIIEIGEITSTSKSSVFDTLSKICTKLDNYEEKLEIYKTSVKTLELLNSYYSSKDIKYLKEIEELNGK